MKKLTKTQQKTLDKMEKGKEYSAYDLQESLTTLWALSKLGLLTEKSKLGSGFFPRTNILFAKKK